MESREAGFPPFPHSLEIPLGLPHSHRLGDGIDISKQFAKAAPNWTCQHRKGLVTDVSGPQRNACPGTLTPLRGLAVAFRVGVAGRNRPAEVGGG